MASRNGLPRRAPRYMRNIVSAAPATCVPNQDIPVAGRQSSVLDSPILPTPSLAPPPPPAFAAKAAAAPVQPSRGRERHDKPLPKQAAQQQTPQIRAPLPQAMQSLTLLRKDKDKEPQKSPKSDPPSQPRQFHQATPKNASIAKQTGNASSSSSSDVTGDFETKESWEADNIAMDITRLSQQVTKMVGDLEMLRAHVVGDRRSRPFTPGSSDRPSIVPRESRDQGGVHHLESQGLTSQDLLVSLNEVTDGSAASPKVREGKAAQEEQAVQEGQEGQEEQEEPEVQEEHIPKNVNYEEWDVSRYKRAKTEHARGLFWTHASSVAKEKMVQALLAEPNGSQATVQARQKLWIPF